MITYITEGIDIHSYYYLIQWGETISTVQKRTSRVLRKSRLTVFCLRSAILGEFIVFLSWTLFTPCSVLRITHRAWVVFVFLNHSVASNVRAALFLFCSFFFFSDWLLNSVYLLKFSWRFCQTWLLSTCTSPYYIIIQKMSSTKEKRRENLQCCGRKRMDEEKRKKLNEKKTELLVVGDDNPLMSSEEWTVNL